MTFGSYRETVCRHFACDRRHRVIAIHKGHQHYKARCHRLSEKRRRTLLVHRGDRREGSVFSFITQLERAGTNQMRLKRLVAFGTQCMTSVGDNLPSATLRGGVHTSP